MPAAAECETACTDGKQCTAPNTCACPSGYGGAGCAVPREYDRCGWGSVALLGCSSQHAACATAGDPNHPPTHLPRLPPQNVSRHARTASSARHPTPAPPVPPASAALTALYLVSTAAAAGAALPCWGVHPSILPALLLAIPTTHPPAMPAVAKCETACPYGKHCTAPNTCACLSGFCLAHICISGVLGNAVKRPIIPAFSKTTTLPLPCRMPERLLSQRGVHKSQHL